MSDRGKGLKEAVPEIFPNAHHGYCFQHIKQNFSDQVAGRYRTSMKRHLIDILTRIAYSVTESDYTATISALEIQSIEAKEWVLRNDVDHWSHARFPGERYLF